MTASSLAAAAEAPSAGGAPLWQLLVLGLVYGVGTGALVAVVYAHRSGRTRALARVADGAGWVFRLPGWSALPVMLAAIGLLLAMWAGVYDIGYHIDYGRDSGPLGNPGHLPLLLGLFLTFAGGFLALGLAEERDASSSWVRIGPGWRAPLGGALLTGCMAFGMAALILDDVWHRIFGQDVTLWSPTHFVYLCGGILTVIGMLVLLQEGAIARRRRALAAPTSTDPKKGSSAPSGAELSIRKVPMVRIELLRGGRDLGARLGRFFKHAQRAALLGGLLCGLELFLTEYDYGVPFYRQVWQPLLLAGFSGFVFVTARVWVGRGAALGAWAVYAVIRSTSILVPLAAGVTESSMPLLLGSALCVELLGLRLDPRRRPLAFGIGAGLLCGTVGFAAEYAWSQVAMPLPWTTALLPEGLLVAAAAGVGGGVLGALLAGALRGELPAPRTARIACVGAFALLIGVAVNAGIKHVPDARAAFTLTDVRSGPQREAMATVRLEPPDVAEDANWLYVLAWQGGENPVVDPLERVGEGVYRTTEPIPLHGTWKSGLRLNSGYARGAVPIRMPADNALPGAGRQLPAIATEEQLERALRESAGAELPAPASFDRPFGDDGLIVLRETKGNVADGVWAAAIAATGLLWGLLVLVLALGLGRLGRGRAASPEPPGRGEAVPAPGAPA